MQRQEGIDKIVRAKKEKGRTSRTVDGGRGGFKTGRNTGYTGSGDAARPNTSNPMSSPSVAAGPCSSSVDNSSLGGRTARRPIGKAMQRRAAQIPLACISIENAVPWTRAAPKTAIASLSCPSRPSSRPGHRPAANNST